MANTTGTIDIRAYTRHIIDDFVSIVISVTHDKSRQLFDGHKYIDYTRFMETVPAFILTPLAAQELMDDLWRCGIRPAAGKGSAGQLKAIENHLADMRKIVAKKIGVEL